MSEPIGARSWLVFFTVSLCTFQTSLSLSIMFVAFPDLRESFPGVSDASLSWVLNLYTVVAAASMIVAGAIGDRWGRKRALVTGELGFVAASVLCALAPGPGVLIAGRAVQALASTLVTPAGAALIVAAFPESRRATAVGMWSASGAAAAAVGPSVGAALVDAGGWRWAFWINLPGGLVGIALALLLLEEQRPSVARRIPDLFGAVVLMAGVGLVVLGLVQSSRWGWSDVRIPALLVGGVVLLVWLIGRSRRHPTPILELSLFRYPAFRLANAGSLVFGLGFFSMFFGYVLFLTEVWSESTLHAGLLMTPVPIATGILSVVGGRVADRLGHRWLMMVGGAAWAAGGLWLFLAAGDTANLAIWLVGLSALGIGAGLVWPSIFAATVIGMPSDSFATATGINQTIQRISTALAVAVAVVLLSDGFGVGDRGSFGRLFVVTVLSGVGAIIVGSRLDTRPKEPMS
ncbi:MAG: MFS transporter [Acidimicrobiales bacterium]|nr:MFS transporter [Acidimicrobiales bacterium]